MRGGAFASVFSVAPTCHEANTRHNEHGRVEGQENKKGVRSSPICVIGCSIKEPHLPKYFLVRQGVRHVSCLGGGGDFRLVQTKY